MSRHAPGGPLGSLALAVLAAGACTSSDPTRPGNQEGRELVCSIPTSQVFNGGPGKDGIPALTNPITVPVGTHTADYLRDDDRVVGVVAGDEVLAIPLNVMWWHEIVNLDIGGRRLAVTHCPLTGSSLAFDRGPLGGAELGVSGLLFRNNLIMYDRQDEESLWPQMLRGARCGVRDGTDLVMFPVVEITWLGWRTLHPETRVVSTETGHVRDYTAYPYGDYDREDNPERLFPSGNIDPRRPPKERVLGIPGDDEGGIAFPFGELRQMGQAGVVDQGDRIVFWDGRHNAAMAYLPFLDEEPISFSAVGGAIVDDRTGSVWQVDGLAVRGPLQGRRLTAVADAYVAYWFAWADFHANTLLWEAP